MNDEKHGSGHGKTSGEGPERDPQKELLQLATVAAHQLKSPLNTIQAVLSTVVGGFLGPIDPRQRQMLEKAVQSCSSSMRLVSDLMRLRTLEDLDSAQLRPVNLLAVFQSALDRVRDAAGLKDIEFVEIMEIKEVMASGWVRGDAGLMEEICHVLLENAVKYTPRNGVVRARIFLEEAGEETLVEAGVCDGSPATLHIEVIDSGIGIPPEAYEKLFTEFYRAPNAKAMAKEGTGLGLAFAARAARALGGTIQLEEADTGGVRALASFPRCPECAAEHAIRLARGETDEGWRGPLASEREEELSQRVVVVGGVAAGSKVVAKIMRLDPRTEVTVVERGRALSYAGCGLPYYISGLVAAQADLVSTPLGEERDSSLLHDVRNLKTLDLSEVVEILRDEKKVRVRSVIDGSETLLPYDQIVLATGASAVIPPIEGVDLEGVYTLHGVRSAEAIKKELSDTRAKDVAIVGGGLLGCEITESIAVTGARVSLIEAQETILGIVDTQLALLVQHYLEASGVRVYTDCMAEKLVARGDRVGGVLLADGREIPCDFVILAAGVKPNVELAVDAGLELGVTGAVKIDKTLRTSDPEIFAIGDCAENHHLVTDSPAWIPMGSTAVKEGRVAAINACGGEETFPGIVGSTVIKIFDYTIARTGLDETQAREAGYDPVFSLIPSLDCAHYIPTARPILIKMIADRSSGKLLGAQGIGVGKIAKRIDIVATALTAGLDLEAFSKLDLGFAPPYSLALDSLLAAANVIRNKIDGLFEGVPADLLFEELASDEPPCLLDVRLASGQGELRISGSMNIPLGSLRGRLHEIPRERPIVVVSRTGLKSYEACLILRSKGFENTRALDGGLEAWPYDTERLV